MKTARIAVSLFLPSTTKGKETRRDLLLTLTAIACAVSSLLAHAQEFPTNIVRIVLPYSAGGGADGLARGIAQRLSDAWGRQVLIDNKPGANTIIGTEYVAKSPADGHVLLMSEPAFVINPSLYERVPYDPFKDFVPITQLVTVNQMLVLNPSLPVSTMQDLIELARKRPGELNYASFGAGSSSHLNMELLQRMAGIKMHHIPYKGGAQAIVDIAAGRTQMMFGAFGLVLGQWKAGKLRVLAVGTAKRMAQYPDIPAISETVPGFESTSWFGLFAPAGTPPKVIEQINAPLRKIFAGPTFRQRYLDPQGFSPVASSPEAFSRHLKSEAQKWGKVVRDAGVKLR